MRKWKFVFGLCAFIFFIDLLKFPFRRDLEFADFLWLIFAGFSLFPLYGYAYQITIGNKVIAIATFTLNALLFVVGVLFSAFVIYAEQSIIVFSMFAVALFLFGVYLYPQFMYAFKSDQLWKENA